MQWIFPGLLAIVFLVTYSFLYKLASPKLGSFNIVQLMSLAAFVVVSTIWIISNHGKVINAPKQAVWLSLLAGVFWGVGQIFFAQMYAKGAPLSVAIPFFTGGLVIGSFLLGVLVLKEPITSSKIIGVVAILFGYFLLTKK